MLVVSVALVLMLSTKIYKPFGEFAKSYMGDYLACLLDRGILPKLGSDDDQCSDSLNLSASNPLAPKAGGLGGAGANGDGAEKDSNKDKKNSSAQDEMSASRSGAGGGNRVIIGPSARGGSRAGAHGSDAAGLNDGKTIEITAAAPKASKYYKFINNGGGSYETSKTVQVRGMDGLLAAEKAKIKRRESKVSKAGVVETAEDLGKPKKLLIKPPERRVATERTEEPWSFSKLIRFAIIAIILIAIFVFLSGQALQISKSWEK